MRVTWMTFFGTKDECNKMHIKYSTTTAATQFPNIWKRFLKRPSSEEKKIMHGRGRSVKNKANANQRFGRKNSMFVPPQICQKRSTLAKLPVVSARRGWSLKRLLYVGIHCPKWLRKHSCWLLWQPQFYMKPLFFRRVDCRVIHPLT